MYTLVHYDASFSHERDQVTTSRHGPSQYVPHMSDRYDSISTYVP